MTVRGRFFYDKNSPVRETIALRSERPDRVSLGYLMHLNHVSFGVTKEDLVPAAHGPGRSSVRDGMIVQFAKWRYSGVLPAAAPSSPT
jgi:hypothetical protein